jgi:hypothetical protein
MLTSLNFSLITVIHSLLSELSETSIKKSIPFGQNFEALTTDWTLSIR